MAHTLNEFEIDANSINGVVLESVHKPDGVNVIRANGTVTVGDLVRNVYWNEHGHCFSYRRKRLEKWDLNL